MGAKISPKFKVGELVIVTMSGVQGEVTCVDSDRDIYTVACPGFTSTYTRPMLKTAPMQRWEAQPCRACGSAFPYDPDADYCPVCADENRGVQS